MDTLSKQDGSRMAKIYGADEVREAITSGKLVNYYQSKVDVTTRQVVGVETLARWFHPQDGMVYPCQFIGVAEAHGLINDLTRVILANALAQAKVWQEAGLMLRVAVNLSGGNLVSLEFVDLVVESATEAGVPPHLVDLEMPTNSLKEDFCTPLEVLTRLRQQQFRLSINDVDIENASLADLRDLPFDEIKITPSFVHGAWNNIKLQAKFNSTTGLAKQLGKSVVAVGVEDQADWEFIRKTECNIAQGFLISKPMPGPDLPGWIRSWHSTEKTPYPSFR
jgi:EAL domain-containing protein (putative c-di-GMP-specific phosphodiesterase class I)